MYYDNFSKPSESKNNSNKENYSEYPIQDRMRGLSFSNKDAPAPEGMAPLPANYYSEQNLMADALNYKDVFEGMDESMIQSYGISKDITGKIVLNINENITMKYIKYLRKKGLDFNKYINQFTEEGHIAAFDEMLIFKNFIIEDQKEINSQNILEKEKNNNNSLFPEVPNVYPSEDNIFSGNKPIPDTIEGLLNDTPEKKEEKYLDNNISIPDNNYVPTTITLSNENKPDTYCNHSSQLFLIFTMLYFNITAIVHFVIYSAKEMNVLIGYYFVDDTINCIVSIIATFICIINKNSCQEGCCSCLISYFCFSLLIIGIGMKVCSYSVLYLMEGVPIMIITFVIKFLSVGLLIAFVWTPLREKYPSVCYCPSSGGSDDD